MMTAPMMRRVIRFFMVRRDVREKDNSRVGNLCAGDKKVCKERHLLSARCGDLASPAPCPRPSHHSKGFAIAPASEVLLHGDQAGKGFLEDVADVGTLGFGEVGVAAGDVVAGEDGVEAGEDRLFQGWGEIFEGEGVDHVATAVFEEAVEELEVFETAAVGAFGGVGGEVGLEIGATFDAAVGEGGFVFEEEGVEDVGGDVVDDAAGGADGFGEDGFAEFFLQALLHVHGTEGGVIGFGEGVLSGGLVFEDHEGDDVALGDGVGFGVEEVGEVVEVGAGGGVEGGVVVAVLEGGVAAVAGGAVVAGDVPAAPAVGEGSGGVDEGAAVAHEGVAFAAGEDGAYEDAGDVWGEGAAVATEAALVAFEGEGLVGGDVGFEEVEDGAEGGVDGGDFDGAAEAVAEVGVVAEVDGAGGLGVDEVVLLAGFGEDEELRGFGDIELLHEAAEDGPGVGAVEFEGA